MARMKMYAFRIEQAGPRSISEIAQNLADRDFADRVPPTGDRVLRLEQMLEGNGLLYLDFAQARSGHGPGRMPRERAMEEFDLAPDESFGEDTAMVVNPATGYAAIQYNHYGPRASAIEKYLSLTDFHLAAAGGGALDFGFTFGHVLRPGAYDRVGRLGLYKQVDFTIALPGARAADVEAGSSVGELLRAPLPQGTEILKITVQASAERNSSLARDGVMGMVDQLGRMTGNLKRAVVTGRDEETGAKETIDLLDEVVSSEAEITPGRGNRYARPERWQALARALQGWRERNELPEAGT